MHSQANELGAQWQAELNDEERDYRIERISASARNHV